MGIGWLWHYTSSVESDQLQASNEYRAFAVYSRWRTLLRGIESAFDAWRRFREQRAGNRELLAMSDHLLRDVGLLRTGNEFKLRSDCHPPRSDQTPSLSCLMASDSSDGCRIIPLEARATPDMPAGVVPDEPSRAA